MACIGESGEKCSLISDIAVPAQASLVREIYRKCGTPGLTAYSAMVGDMPIKNWGGVGITDYTVASAAKNSAVRVIKYQKRKYACQGCPLACGGIIDIKKEFFDTVGWDLNTGGPTAEKIKELGIEGLCD